jgi:hypothetical protein
MYSLLYFASLREKPSIPSHNLISISIAMALTRLLEYLSVLHHKAYLLQG